MPRQTLTDKVCARKPGKKSVDIWDTATPGFGIRISPKGRRTFMVQFRVSGKQKRATVGRYPNMSLSEARKAASALKDKANAGQSIKYEPKPTPTDDGTFKSFAESYLRTGVSKKTKRPVRELRTFSEMERMIQTDLYSAWQRKQLSEITTVDVRKVIREKRATAPISAERLLALLRAMFSWGADEGIIETSPAAGVSSVYRAQTRSRVLGPDEIKAVWAASDELGYPFGSMVQMLLLTAQRLREVAQAPWEEFNLDKGEWVIPGSRTKNKRPHLVPLSPAVVDLLNDLPRTGPMLFTTAQDGDVPVSGFSRAKRRLDKLIAGADEEPPIVPQNAEQLPHWTYHDLRRTAATGMERIGVDPYTIGQILNHSPTGITRRSYALYDREPEKRVALERWAAEVGRLKSGKSAKVIAIRK